MPSPKNSITYLFPRRDKERRQDGAKAAQYSGAGYANNRSFWSWKTTAKVIAESMSTVIEKTSHTSVNIWNMILTRVLEQLRHKESRQDGAKAAQYAGASHADHRSFWSWKIMVKTIAEIMSV